MKFWAFQLISIVFGLLVWFLPTNANASNLKFYNINDLHGISMRQATSVCRDDNGFVWAATKSGILRLTDDDYRVYQLPYETMNVLWSRLLFKEGNLWAYTNNGQVFKYNPIKDQFLLDLNIGNQITSTFYRLLFQEKDVYWVASSVGIYRASHSKLELFAYKDKRVNAIGWYSKSKLFAVTPTTIELVDIKTSKTEVIYKTDNEELRQIRSIYFDAQHNRLWLGSNSSGLLYFDVDSKKFHSLGGSQFPNQPVLSMAAINDQDLMVGVDGQGLWCVDRRTARIKYVYKEDLDALHSLRGNGVYDVYHDTITHRVWISTYTGGVSYFDQATPIIEQITHQVNQYNSLISNDVNSMLEDSKGNLWFATNNGISFWNVSTNQWRHFYVNEKAQAQVFLTLFEDARGRIWAGSYASGVYILDRDSGRELHHYTSSISNSPFDNNFVFDIVEDSSGEIWIIGVEGEIVRYNPKSDEFKRYWKQPVSVIAQYNDSIMYVGLSYGIMQFNKKNEAFHLVLEHFYVQDILVHNNLVWLGTGGSGLVCFDPQSKEIEQFTVSQGLPSDFVNSVTFSNGYLWLGTEKGLCRFNPENKQFFVYSAFPALTNFSFNANAHVQLKNGKLAWGTNNGVVMFDPETIHQEQVNGRIYFQDLNILGRSVRETPSFKLDRPVDQLESLKLRHNQNSITIELLPVGTAGGSKFSWKLEGLDSDWTTPSNHRLLSYNNIPHRKYVLKIRMYDNSLSQIIAERELIVKVTPPFWASWWFLVVVFLLISVLIYSIFWYYINKLKQLHTEEKVRFFTNTAHDIRTSLTLIKAPVEELNNEPNLTTKGKHFLKLATEQTRRLADVVTQLMDFQKVDIGREQLKFARVDVVALVKNRTDMFMSLAKSRHVKLKFNSNKANYETGVDENQIEKVIDNLISNALKYSKPQTMVQVSLNCIDNQWILSVKDQGIGIAKSDQKRLFKEFYRAENAINTKVVGSGVGLLLVKNIAGMHGGTINFTSTEGVGSEFVLAVPYRKVEEAGHAIQYTDIQLPESNKVRFDDESNDDADSDSADKKMRILLVEDHEELLQFLQLAFEDTYDVYTASNGAVAWELIQNELPDLVISDVMMPKMDGFELCKLMKSSYETSHIPLVLLTALTDKAQQLEGLGLGADDYLTKPFDTSLLQQKIRSIIQNRVAIQEKAMKLIKTDNEDPVLNNALNDQFLKRMLEVVHENLGNSEFNKDDFASALHVSGSLLYKKIKALTNQSPVDFIKSVRMNRALELLQTRKFSITEVSELCGFTSAGYFSTVFKRYFGKSPSEV
jgi:signal transduction histidine kinase/CheY-like chemotaxis protein/ligand-binding sensor domain-containing protein/AraC-like DNA-binding protein